MTFYLKPPRGYLNLHKLEECVKQRLLFYQKTQDDNLENLNYECLVEDSSLDRTGHYLLRLFAFANTSFKFIFINKEKQLLEKRLSSYGLQDVKRFLKKILRQTQDNLKNDDNISDILQNMYIVLMEVFTEMSDINYLQHVFDHKRSYSDSCEQYCMRVPFQYCSSLISSREVQLSNGYALISCEQWQLLLTSIYETYLVTMLKEMRYSRCVEESLEDDRIKGVLKLVGKYNFTSSNFDYRKQSFSLDQIHSEAKLFPLCMFNLFHVLQRTNRLAHNDRFDFSLFLKGVGMSMNDSLKLWQAAYSKNHASCSRCTHDWQTNEKRYIYGIRHLYGLEGARKSYSSRSCNFLQEKVLGVREDGGCPFKHFDDTSLKRILLHVCPADQKQEVEVMIHKRKEDPTMACQFLHTLMHKDFTNQETLRKFVFQSPVQYYVALREGIKNVNAEISIS